MVVRVSILTLLLCDPSPDNLSEEEENDNDDDDDDVSVESKPIGSMCDPDWTFLF